MFKHSNSNIGYNWNQPFICNVMRAHEARRAEKAKILTILKWPNIAEWSSRKRFTSSDQKPSLKLKLCRYMCKFKNESKQPILYVPTLTINF